MADRTVWSGAFAKASFWVPLLPRNIHPGSQLRSAAGRSNAAPFVGTAIGFALARGPLDIGLALGALGLGMAAPFLAIAAAPGVVAYPPRPGAWMVWLRPVLGLALLSTAIWLLFVLGVEAGTAAAGLGGAMLAALLAALAWHHRLTRGQRSRRPIQAGAIALAILVVLMPSPSGKATPVELARSSNAAESWQRFDEPALHRMISSRKTVRIDVTPASCRTCKADELAVLDRSQARGPVARPERDRDASGVDQS